MDWDPNVDLNSDYFGQGCDLLDRPVELGSKYGLVASVFLP